METALNWLRNSFFLGWLLRDWSQSGFFQGSLVMRLLTRLLAGARSWMKSSYSLGWAVDAGGLEGEIAPADFYASSLVISAWSRLRRAFLSLIWATGRTLQEWTENSFIWRRPLGFLGLIVFFYLAMDIGVNQPGWKTAAVKTLVALAALSLTLVRPTREWWEASLLSRFLRWWIDAEPRGEYSARPVQQGHAAAGMDSSAGEGHEYGFKGSEGIGAEITAGVLEAVPAAQKESGASASKNRDTSRERVELSLFLVVAYVFIDYVLRSFGPLAFLTGIWDELVFIGLVGLWLVRIGWHQLTPRTSRFVVPYLFFAAVFVFLYLIKPLEPAAALEGLRVYVEYVLWFFVGAYMLEGKLQFRWLCDVFILIAFILALHGIYQYIVGVQIPSRWIDSARETTIKTRVFSIIGSPNILGSLMVLGLSMTLASFFAYRRWDKKFIYIVMGLAMLACLVFTMSRGAWLSFGLALILAGLWLDRRIIWGLIIIAILTPAAVPSVYHRLAYMTTPEFKASSERGGRLGRWDKTLRIWQTQPATGVGLGKWGGAVAKRFYPDYTFYTDNFWLKTGAETGWLGLLTLLLLIITGLRLARSSLDRVDEPAVKALGLGVLAGLIGILAHNAVENVFEVPMMSTYFWFFLGMLSVLGALSPGTERPENE